MSIKSTIEAQIRDYQDSFKRSINKLNKEIIKDSPVDKGRFKQAWVVDRLNIEKLEFKMTNNTEYGLALWEHQHSPKGWSPIGGAFVVNKHVSRMRNNFRRINKKKYSV